MQIVADGAEDAAIDRLQRDTYRMPRFLFGEPISAAGGLAVRHLTEPRSARHRPAATAQ